MKPVKYVWIQNVSILTTHNLLLYLAKLQNKLLYKEGKESFYCYLLCFCSSIQ